jgi:hypothetical protein
MFSALYFGEKYKDKRHITIKNIIKMASKIEQERENIRECDKIQGSKSSVLNIISALFQND